MFRFLCQGKCTCHEMTSSPIYLEPGHSTVEVEWPIPQFTCKAGRRATVKTMEVTPQLESPHFFSIGEHLINYTFKLKGGVTVTCPVTITVKGALRIKPSQSLFILNNSLSSKLAVLPRKRISYRSSVTTGGNLN